MSTIRTISCALILIFLFPYSARAIPQKGEQAPPFRVTSTTGQQITLSDYRGKVLLVEYFATWCSPCRDSAAHLVKLNKKFGKRGVQILGISLDDDDDTAIRDYITANRLNFPVARGGDGMKSDYAIRTVPTLYVIGKKGLIADKFIGYNTDIENRLDRLLLKLIAE